MYDDFSFRVAWLEEPIPAEKIRGMLEAQKEIPGSFTPLGPRGLRFIPDEPLYPPTYFGPDGRVIELVTKDLDAFQIDHYLAQLARIFGVKIVTDTVEYA